MNAVQKTLLNKRSLNVFVMLFSFLLLPFSGILIHDTHGISERALLRHFAMSVHNLAAIIFLISCIIHIIFNRNTILKYLSAKTDEYLKLRKEFLIAFIIVFGIVGLFTIHVFHVR